MKTIPLMLAAAIAAAAMPALASETASIQPAAQSAEPDSKAMGEAIDQRISALKTKLDITPAETPSWNTFADAMRNNADSTNALFAQRAQKTETMSAVENMKNYATLARAYADNLDKLSSAFDTLYGELSPQQQKTADALFRQQPEKK